MWSDTKAWEVGLFFVLLFHSGSTLQPSTSCLKAVTAPKFQAVYQGWPHLLSCRIFVDTSDYNWYEITTNSSSAKCLITKPDGSVVWSNIVKIVSLDDPRYDVGYLTSGNFTTSQLEFNIKLVNQSTNFCIFTTIQLNVTSFQPISCQQFLASPRDHAIERDIGIGKHLYIECGKNSIDTKIFPKVDAQAGVRYQLQYNCTNLLPSRQVGGESVLNLEIKHLNQSGSYICSATYGGMTRYLSNHDVCVFEASNINTALLSCTSTEVLASAGTEAEFQCQGNFGHGRLDPNHFRIEWAKIHHGKMEKLSRCSERSSNKNNVSCLFINPNGKCIKLSQDSSTKTDTIVEIRLLFSYVRPSNYGQYLLMITKNGILRTNMTLLLEPNRKPALISETIVIGISIGAFLLLMIFTAILLYNNVYVRVYYKKYFGVYLLDDKIYGASFGYNFSSSIDVFEKENMQTSILSIRELLEDMGYSVYDADKDGWVEFERAENLQYSLKNSHRFVIFLSLGFIKDGWSLLTLQQGFEAMIDSGAKLIFILLPGMKEYLKQHSKHDPSSRVIQRAIKLNHSIEWTPYVGKKQLRFQLSDAMPKLRSQSSRQIFSVSTYMDEGSENQRSSIYQQPRKSSVDSSMNTNCDKGSDTSL